MAHTHTSNTKRIWVVFGILSLITVVEVALGIAKPDFLHLSSGEIPFTEIKTTSPLNWIFIILTLAKAYGIAWAFMHLEGEKTWFRRVIVWTLVFYIIYLLFIVLIEGSYLNSTLGELVKW